MPSFIKNIKQGELLSLADQVTYQPGQIVSKTLSQNEHHSLTLFAFDKDSEISTHASDGDALATVLNGTGQLTVDGQRYIVSAGESVVMPAGKPHSVYAKERFKMFLTVIFN